MFDTRTRLFFFACLKDAAGAALKNAAPAPGSDPKKNRLRLRNTGYKSNKKSVYRIRILYTSDPDPHQAPRQMFNKKSNKSFTNVMPNLGKFKNDNKMLKILTSALPAQSSLQVPCYTVFRFLSFKIRILHADPDPGSPP